MARHGRVGFDLLSQIGPMYPDVMEVFVMPGSPDNSQQLAVEDILALFFINCRCC